MGANSGDIFDLGEENNKIQYERFRFDQNENALWQRLLESITQGEESLRSLL